MKGWVYIITNKSMPNLLNIGFSNNDPVLKSEELNKSEIPHPYIVEYDALVNEPKEIAQKIQAILSHCHENKGWFRSDVPKAIIAIRQAAADSIIVENNRNAEVKKPEIFKREPAQTKPEAEKITAKSLDIQDLYIAVIGEKNTDYYLAQFENFDKRQDDKLSWNWSAFLFTGFWALYRKMYGWFFVYWGIVSISKLFENVVIPKVWLLIYLGISISFATLANSFYYAKVKQKIKAAQHTIKNETTLFESLQYKGGVNTWVTWVFGVAPPVIGIVASIAIPTMYPAQTAIKPMPDMIVERIPNVSQSVSCKNNKGLTEDELTCLVNEASDKHSDECMLINSQRLARIRKFAEQGCANAQSDLGAEYANGWGFTKDEAQAIIWYRKAAEQSDTGAQRALGRAYEEGKGVEQDAVIAEGWYRKAVEEDRKAAEQGDLLAQYDLAQSYLEGKGVAKDETQAIFWFRKSAEQGNDLAKNELKKLGQ